MAMEYKLPFTADEITEKLKNVDKIKWKNIEDKPFGETTVMSDTLTWDGNLDNAILMDGGTYIVKLSSDVPSLEMLSKGGTAETLMGTFNFTGYGDLDNGMYIATVDEATLEALGGDEEAALMVFPFIASTDLKDGDLTLTKGIYMFYVPLEGLGVNSFKVNDYKFVDVELKYIDTKYLEPFHEKTSYSETLTWNGDMSNKELATHDFPADIYFVHVSDVVPTASDFENGARYKSSIQSEATEILSGGMMNIGNGVLLEQNMNIAVVQSDNTTVSVPYSGMTVTVTLPKKGIYFVFNNALSNGFQFVEELTIDAFNKFPITQTLLKEEYLPYIPSSNGGGGCTPQFGEITEEVEVLTWDGNTNGLESVMGMTYLISEVVPTLEDLQKGGSQTFMTNGVESTENWTSEDISDFEANGMGSGILMIGSVVIALKDGATIIGDGTTITFPKAGIYFMGMDDDGNGVFDYVKEFSINDYKFITTTIKRISGKYLDVKWDNIDGAPVYKKEDYILPVNNTVVTDGTSTLSLTGDLIIGETYTVLFDGKEYLCSCYDVYALDTKVPSLGNSQLLGLDTNVTTEPFFIALAPIGGLLLSSDGIHQIGISGTKIKKLDNDLLDLDWIPAPVKEKVLFGSYTFRAGENYKQLTDALGYHVKPNDIVLVKFDDVLYTCKTSFYGESSNNGAKINSVGNASIYDSSKPDTGEPFFFHLPGNSNGWDIYVADDTVEHSLEVYIFDDIKKPIPDEYLPSRLVDPVNWSDIVGKICDTTTVVTETMLFENLTFNSKDATYTETTSGTKVTRRYRIDLPEEYKGKLPLRNISDCKYRIVMGEGISTTAKASVSYSDDVSNTLGQFRPPGLIQDFYFEEEANIGNLYLYYAVRYNEGETCTDPVFNFTLSLYEIITREEVSPIPYKYTPQEVKESIDFYTEKIKTDTLHWNGSYEGVPYVVFGNKTYVRVPYEHTNKLVSGHPTVRTSFSYDLLHNSTNIKFGDSDIIINSGGFKNNHNNNLITDGTYVFLVKRIGSYDVNGLTMTFPETGLYLLRDEDSYVSEFNPTDNYIKFETRVPKTRVQDYVVLESSTAGSSKQFKITVDDNGTIKATQITS